MGLKSRFPYLFINLFLFLGIYKMCKCGDIYPRKQMFGELCWVCYHNKKDLTPISINTIPLEQIEEQGKRMLRRSEERKKHERKEDEEGL